MKFDNFNTARCAKCGWLRQFQPGVDYETKDFECNCKPIVEEKPIKQVSKPNRKELIDDIQGESDANSRTTTKEDN